LAAKAAFFCREATIVFSIKYMDIALTSQMRIVIINIHDVSNRAIHRSANSTQRHEIGAQRDGNGGEQYPNGVAR
jgi:hypothetical protein